MSRIIVTTCGTSLYASSCWKGLNAPPLSTISLEDREALRKKQSKCEGAIMEAQIDDPEGETFAERFDEVSWNNLDRLRDLPAELASLRVIIEALKSKNEELTAGDKIILLHSDNEGGRFCVNVIERVLKALLPDIRIEPDEVEGLDPVKAKQLVDALRNIWSKYYHMLNDNNDTRFIFNLTGGYKAISMILAALSGLLVLSPESSGMPDIAITYLHESAPTDNLFSIYWDKGKSILNAVQLGFGSDNNYGAIAPGL